MVRLTDFAEQNRITARTVQLHIQANATELEGHVDRRGKNGTWLDEFAVNFLLGVIRLPSKDDVVVPTLREAALMAQVAEANLKWAEAERRAGANAEAAGKVSLLEAHNAEQKDQISALSIELGAAKERLQASQNEAGEALSRLAAVEEKLAMAEKERDDARAENEALKQHDEAMKRRGLLARIFRKGE